MAAQIADRLSGQEEEIRRLSDEIGRLLDLGLTGTVEANASPALEQLRTENEKLKYRIVHLQRSLKEEQERGRPEESSGQLCNGRLEKEEKKGCSGEEEDGATGERPGDGAKAAPEDKQNGCEKPSTQQNKRKKVKKSGSEVGPKQEEKRTLPCGMRGGPKNNREGHTHTSVVPSVSRKDGHPDFFQLIHRREYWDTMRQPWKVIFPLQGALKETATTIILLRLEEYREPATQDQVVNVSDCMLPRWLEHREGLQYRSPDATWKVLFKDPSPDNYLLLLKKDQQLLDCIKDEPHPMSCHLLK